MEQKVSNFLIFTITLIIILIIVATKTIMTMNERHDDRLIYAMESKVEYYAKRCYLESSCTGEITLNDLYNKGYLKEEIINPVTKEVINADTKINYINSEILINW